jgi:hypothetical protein
LTYFLLVAVELRVETAAVVAVAVLSSRRRSQSPLALIRFLSELLAAVQELMEATPLDLGSRL